MRKALAELPHMHATMPLSNTKLDSCGVHTLPVNSVSTVPVKNIKFDLDFGLHANHPM